MNRAVKFQASTPFPASMTCDTFSKPIACRIINEALDNGDDLDKIFYTGEESGFELTAYHVGENRFAIEFGYLCPPEMMAGDGGEWDITFRENRTIVKMDGGSSWIS